MEHDIIQQFADEMAKYGCAPRMVGEILADDVRHRISCDQDKARQKTIGYQLKIEDGVGIGWFHSFKFGSSAGSTVRFISKISKSLTPQERELFKQRIEIAKKEAWAKEKKRYERQKRMARRLTSVIEKMPSAGEHPYLVAKKVKAHPTLKWRAKTNELIVPVIQPDGYAWTVQKIGVKGDKWFLCGGSAKGGFFPFFTDDQEPETLIIAEGFATGATIQEQGSGHVVCAMTAGNLKPVAELMRKQFPNANIVIAADNDRNTKDNPGITKAKQAASAVKGFIVYPDFPESDKKGVDWNDYINAHGQEQWREKMKPFEVSRTGGASVGNVVIPASPTRPPLEIKGDWRDDFHCDRNGVPQRGSIHNALLVLENHEDYRGIFKLNDFSKEIYVTRCPVWDDPQTFNVHRVDDVDITNCCAALEREGITPDVGKVFKAIASSAERHKFHPARDYFDGLVWDGKERLKSWLSYYMGAEGDAPEYLEFIGKKWLTAAVKRIYEPGCKFDHVLVIEGTQGKGKSSALEEMATFEGEQYFTDNIRISDIQQKDSILLLQGSILVELAELAGFNKKDDEEIKGWITLKQDRCRKPYDRMITVFKRQFVLSATTNNYDYLKDPTGNRRYWPFKSSALDLEAIKRDKKQLWAEAVTLYKSGLYLGPTEEEARLATAAQEMRRSVDSWEDEVMDACIRLGARQYEGFKVTDILEKIGLEFRERDQRSTRRVTSILQSNGFENVVRRINDKPQRVWVRNEKI